ncbi:MAG: zinc-ribbon domain-containing protein [Clostridia bacterium]|nr:zinc-ribbon domain-containing protein [Clostridia bacterium]
MFCSHCGKEVSDEAYVCTYCGCLVGKGKAPQKDSGEQANVMAILGLIFALFCPILGIVFGAIGMVKAKELNGTGERMASWSIVLSIIVSILFITAVVAIA